MPSPPPPVAANTVRHMRDGGKVASAVQIPEGADDGRPVAVQRFMAHDDPAVLRRAVAAAARGALTIPISATFSFSEAAEAQKALAQGPSGRSCWSSKPEREARLALVRGPAGARA